MILVKKHSSSPFMKKVGKLFGSSIGTVQISNYSDWHFDASSKSERPILWIPSTNSICYCWLKVLDLCQRLHSLIFTPIRKLSFVLGEATQKKSTSLSYWWKQFNPRKRALMCISKMQNVPRVNTRVHAIILVRLNLTIARASNRKRSVEK